MSVLTEFYFCGIFGGFCSCINQSRINLGVAGAAGVGGFPFSLYSNHLSEKGDLDNPKGDL